MKPLLLAPALLVAFSGMLAAQTPAILTTAVDPASGNTYHLLDNSNWTDAEAAAVALGGHLATVEDLAENSFLTSSFSNFGGVTRHLWIGYSDAAVETTWTWASGSTSTFENWWVAGGAPNNSTVNDPIEGEDFCCIYPTGEWEDLDDVATSMWFPVLNGVVEIDALGTAYCFGDGSGAACPCGNTGGSDSGCANSSGSGAILTGDGSASVASDDATFQCTNLLPNQPALLFVGESAIGSGDGVSFGDGLRCAGSNVVRLGVQVPDAGGNANWGPGLGAAGGWSAGETRYFQTWYRDPSGGPCGIGFNLTNGVEIDFQP